MQQRWLWFTWGVLLIAQVVFYVLTLPHMVVLLKGFPNQPRNILLSDSAALLGWLAVRLFADAPVYRWFKILVIGGGIITVIFVLVSSLVVLLY